MKQEIKSSPVLFIEKCCKIKDKNKNYVPFKLNKQQKELLDIMEKFRFIIVCKQRQVGITSVVAAKAIYMCVTRAGTACLLMSYRNSSTRDIYNKLKDIYLSIPQFMSVKLTINNKEEMRFANGSSITVATCSLKETSHGSTYHYVHISEAALCGDSLSNRLASIESALTPNGIICLESTPQAGLTYFSKLYTAASRGENLYHPVFFSWVDDKNGMHDAEQKQFALEYKTRFGSLPSCDDLDREEKELYRKGVTFEMLAWRRLKIKQQGKKCFNTNFPVCAATAFMSCINDNMFDIEAIHLRLNALDDVEPIPMPHDLPDSLKEFYGRGFDLWGLPRAGVEYYIGVDCSEGVGKNSDYSVIEIIDQNGFQAGELRTKTKPFIFAKLCNDTGRYFNNGMLVIERASSGHAVLCNLKEDYNYPNLYRAGDYDKHGKPRRTDGFSTNCKTKPIMIDDFTEWFEKAFLCINSKTLLTEMSAFVFKNGKREAATGHDDCVMAMAMAIQAAKEGKYYI